MSSRRTPYNDNELQSASKYLIYHVRMYVETKIWLDANQLTSARNWETVWNAVLEDHLVHARVLIHFLSKDKKGHPTDVLALDYFYDNPSLFSLLTDAFLKSQADDIGGQMVHLTTKAMPLLKSNQNWPIDNIMGKLIPVLQNFFLLVPSSRLGAGIKTECLSYLRRLTIHSTPISLSVST